MLPHIAPLFAQAPATNFWMLGGVVAAGLLAFAGGIVLHVLAAAPGRRPSLRETFGWARGFLWTLPVLAVMALVVGRAAPRFQEPAAAQAEVPKALQIDLKEADDVNIGRTEPGGARPAAKNAVAVARPAVDRPANGAETTPVGDKPEIKSTSRLPEWISTPVSKDGDATLIVLESKEQPTLSEAEREVAARAAARVHSDFEQRHPTNIDWTVPSDAVKFRLAFEEKIPRQAGNVSFTMFKVHRQLELSDETRRAAFNVWRAAVVKERLRALGTVTGLAALIVAGSALYLRLDARTGGLYRTRLKAAAVAALTAAGLLATALV